MYILSNFLNYKMLFYILMKIYFTNIRKKIGQTFNSHVDIDLHKFHLCTFSKVSYKIF